MRQCSWAGLTKQSWGQQTIWQMYGSSGASAPWQSPTQHALYAVLDIVIV